MPTSSTAHAGPRRVDTEDIRMNFDPVHPQARFREAGLPAVNLTAEARLPTAIPWPTDAAPQGVPLSSAPADSDDLTKFRGYDAVVVTWTAAEGATLAQLFTPGHLLSSWYEYRHNVAQYIPLVTGSKAPFNDSSSDMVRYYHSMGLYFPCKIGNAKVLVFKSGLHLDYDGPATPVKKLIQEIATAVQPKIFITTGTGGGIGKDALLADVVIAPHARFDCTTQFKTETWANASYPTSPLPSGAAAAITPAMLKVNASRVTGARVTPKIWDGTTDSIVTTDFYGFDDSTDYYKLQGKGRACDMGDAMVGQALQSFPGVKWYAIRNVSDPQMPNTDNDIGAADTQAGKIYSEYGALTTASSLIATWAVIHSAINGK